ncbi:hypothetical protein HDU90_006729 [Geranomyces variabilis]|nr:hypothetical protein HDU90_006729 [Geranomyces variabilis]
MPSPPDATPIAYAYLPHNIAQNVATEVRSIAAGMGTAGLQEHADKIFAGLHRMGDGMDSAGRNVRWGLIVVGLGVGFGLTVIGVGIILEALVEDDFRGRRPRKSGGKRRKRRHEHGHQSREGSLGSPSPESGTLSTPR